MAAKTEKDSRVAGNIVVDTILTLIVFVIFFLICRSHVPSEDAFSINLWGAITALCLTGVFWLAWQMFRVTLRGQRDGGRGE